MKKFMLTIIVEEDPTSAPARVEIATFAGMPSKLNDLRPFTRMGLMKVMEAMAFLEGYNLSEFTIGTVKYKIEKL